MVYLCHDGEGNVVLQKRGQNARDENGRWDIGGGAIEFGQTAYEALEGEISEELSTDVLDHTFLGYRDVHREKDGQSTHWVALDFLVRVDPEKVVNGEPHKFDDVRWFALNDMPENLHSQLPKFWQQHKERIV